MTRPKRKSLRVRAHSGGKGALVLIQALLTIQLQHCCTLGYFLVSWCVSCAARSIQHYSLGGRGHAWSSASRPRRSAGADRGLLTLVILGRVKSHDSIQPGMQRKSSECKKLCQPGRSHFDWRFWKTLFVVYQEQWGKTGCQASLFAICQAGTPSSTVMFSPMLSSNRKNLTKTIKITLQPPSHHNKI